MKRFISFMVSLAFAASPAAVLADGTENTVENVTLIEDVQETDTEIISGTAEEDPLTATEAPVVSSEPVEEGVAATVPVSTTETEDAAISTEPIFTPEISSDLDTRGGRWLPPVQNMTPEEESEYWGLVDSEAAALTDDEILAMDSVSAYSNSFSGWKSCGTMTTARSYMSSVAVGDDIYTFGGLESGKAVNYTEVYDTDTEVWTRKMIMPRARYKHTALAVGNKVYICGGYGSNGDPLDSIDVYDVVSNTWEPAIDTPASNTNYSAAAYDGMIYIFGGESDGETCGDVYCYSIETDSWSYVTEYDVTFYDAQAVTNDNSISVFYDNKMYTYYIDDDRWSSIGLQRDLVDFAVISRRFTGDFDCERGCYLTGGRPEDSDVATAAVSAFYTEKNFSADAWCYDLRLIRGLAAHNMVEANGCIYVFGGQVVKGTDQKLMFKRSVDDEIDDVPGTSEIKGTSVIGSLNKLGDTDTFKIIPDKTQIYMFRPLDYWSGVTISLYESSPSGNSIGRFLYYSDDEIINYGFSRMLTAGKTYYIKVNLDSSWYNSLGNYAFIFNPVDDDAPNILEESGGISLGHEYDREFEAIDDADCFKFEATKHGKYYIPFNVADADTVSNDYSLDIFCDDAHGNKVKLYSLQNSSDESSNTVILDQGTYYLKFTSKKEADYTFSVTQTGTVMQLNAGRMKHEMVSTDNMLYVIGGSDSDFNTLSSMECSEQNDGIWMVSDSISGLQRGFAAASVGDNIYIVGGYGGGTYDNTIRVYNTQSAQTMVAGGLVTGRERAGIAEYSGRLYIIGGRSGSGYLDNIEVYDTSTSELLEPIELPKPMMDVQAFFNNDTLYIIGGVNYNGYSDEVYAFENGQWVQKASMPYASEYMRGKGYNGGFICAAVNGSGNVDILKYDADSDDWTVLENNFISSLIYYAVELSGGYLYITGGYSYGSNTAVDTVYMYDYITEISAADRDIPVRRMGFEYEQTVSDTENVEKPEISGVTAQVLDSDRGIYKLTVDNYTCDPRVVPFFFWSAREGTFRSLSSDYKTVMFYADPGTGDRQVKVTVGIGDGRGYVDKKAFLLNGNNETE